ncbi:MAG: flagellar hook-length control protein FliK [Candidatus Eremiobacteraeota bacterium]|nr:flagellar hook-length control protein FliK [Candidatus Eremiobacteraeota bacterium]
MSSLLLTIGASAAPSALGVSGASRVPGRHSRIAASQFGELLKKRLTPSEPNAAVDQIATLIGSGTPTSTIIDRLAQELGAKVQTAFHAVTGKSLDAHSKAKLIRALTTALSPPDSQAPPGTTTQQAASLAQRLAQVLTRIAGELTGSTGQQNRLSGNILDAKSAKEILARQTPPTPASADIAALVQSLLSGAAKNPVKLPPSGLRSEPPASGANGIGGFSKHPITLPTNGFKPPPADPVVSTLPVMHRAEDSAPKSFGGEVVKTPEQPNNILMRILQRAAGVDARTNGSPEAAGSATPASGNHALSPGALFDRLVAAIERSAQAFSGNAGKDNQQSSSDSNAFGSNSKPADVPGVLPQGATPFVLTGVGNADIPQNPAINSTAAPAPVDPSALIDQVVQGMLMRSSGNASEIRMKLAPEHLGEIAVKLNVSGASMSATIIAQNADVRDALLANQSQLTRSLADAGVKLTGFSVDVSGGNQQQHQNTHHLGGSRHLHQFGNEETDDEITAAVPTFGPPLVATSRLDLLNYLA